MAKQITRRNEAWVQKSIAAQAAQSHTDKMDTHYGGLIAQAAYYTEEFDIPAPKVVINPPKQDTKIFCIAETTSQAIFHIAQQSFVASIYNCGYERIGVLNFASFKNPGGMFIEGSMAQEESLCHDSFLYNVLRLKPEYYAKNRADVNRSLYYSNMLYSPNILFIDDEKNLQVEVDVITSAAPNASAALKRNDVDMKDVFDAMVERIDRILYVAFSKHIDTLILGAYGCGVFGNDPEMVASLFASALSVKYRGCFNTVYFAIPRSKYNNNYNTFSIIINRFIDEDGYLLPVDDELLSQATFDISDYEDEDDEV